MALRRYRREWGGIMRTRFVVVAVTAMIGGSTSAWAADIYVDAAAAAGGDGSAGMPFQEVQAGLELAQPGDVVHVAPGMYPAIRTVRAGTEDMRISVVADSRRTAILSGPGTALEYAHDYHTFQGLVFDGGYVDQDLIVGDGGNHIEFTDVEVRRSSNDCFDLRNSTDITIDGSFIHHCISVDETGAIDDSHGITGDSVFDLTVRNTEIAMASGDSVQLSPPREPWGNLLIENCTLWTAPNDDPDAPAPLDTPMGENAFDSKVGAELDGNGANPRVVIRDVVAYGFVGFIGNQTPFNLKEAVDATVDRVTIHDSELGFRIRGPAAVVRISNAVVYGVDNVVRYEDGITGVVISNTTIGGNIGSDLFEDGGGGGWNAPVIENLLVLDAAPPADANAASSMMVGADVFLDAAGDDYRLVEGSAPIDAGVALADVTEDRDGVARPYGAGVDIGAYEWNPDTGPAEDSGGTDESATGVDDTSGDELDGTAGDSGSESAGAEAEGPEGGTLADSGEGSSGSGQDDGGGCSCRTTAGPGATALLVLIAAGFRTRGRPRGTRRDRRADGRASRAR